MAGTGGVTRHLGGGLCGILPLVEHLCQRCGSAARQAAAVTVHGALVVVGIALVPFGNEHRFDALGAITLERGLFHFQPRVGLEVLHLLLVGIQPELHVLGQAAHVLQRTVTIGKDFLGTVVTSDNDKAAVGVHHIISGLVGAAGIHLLMDPLDGGSGSIEAALA